MASYSGQITTASPLQCAALTSTGTASLTIQTTSGAATFQSGLSANNQTISAIAAPSAGTDAANKTYVDAAIASATNKLNLATESIALSAAATTPAVLDANFALHSGTGGTASSTSTTTLGTVASAPVGSSHFLNAALITATATWQVDFGAGNIVDANGTARRYVNLLRGQSLLVQKVAASTPQFALGNAGAALA